MRDFKNPQTARQGTSTTLQTQNTQQPSQAHDRLRLVPRQGLNQEIAAPRQQLTNDTGPLNDYSPSSGHVENKE
jgi:hypothetical protein